MEIGRILKLYYGVYDLKTGLYGKIEGPAAQKTLKVQWQDGKQASVQVGGSIRKVIEGSIEYMALAEPQTCLWLFRENPQEFFTILIGYREKTKGGPVSEEKILGKRVSSKGAAKKAVDQASYREMIIDKNGKQLFPDRAAFAEGWDRAVSEWASMEEPPIVVTKVSTSKLQIIDTVDVEIQSVGGAAPIDTISFDAIYAQDLEDMQTWMNEFVPSTVFENLVKNTVIPKKNFALITEDWSTLIEELSLISPNELQSLISKISESSSGRLQSIWATIAIAKGLQINKSFFDEDSCLQEFLINCRSIATIPDSTRADVWVSELCKKLHERKYAIQIDKDYALVSAFLALPSYSAKSQESLLGQLCDWLESVIAGKFKDEAALRLSLSRTLMHLTGGFTSSRVRLLKLCDSFEMDLRIFEYFKGIDVEIILANQSLADLVSSNNLIDVIVKPILTSYLNAPEIRLEALVVILSREELAERLSKWGLSEAFNSKFWAAWGSDNTSYLKDLIEPKETNARVEMLESALAECRIDLEESAVRNKSLRNESDELSREFASTRSQLEAAQKSSQALLESLVLQEVFSTARHFAKAARLIRLSLEALPASQIKASIDAMLTEVSITATFQVGQHLPFDSSKMDSVTTELEAGTMVEVIDPLFELILAQGSYILTPALVRPIMGT